MDLAYLWQCCKLGCSKKSLVDSQTGKTKRRFADVQQDVLHDGLAGSKTRPLQISGAPIAGHGMMICTRMLDVALVTSMQEISLIGKRHQTNV